MNTKVKGFKSAGFRSVFVAVVMLAALLRSAKATRPPRVYNALITSDQQILPSQADPIVTPVLRPYRYFYAWPAVHYAAAVSVPAQAVPSASPHAEDAYAAEPDSSSEVPNATAAEGDGPRTPAAGVFMNNKPAGSSVPDVPPPPPPFAAAAGGKKDKKKKAEEYPPAPVGFAI